MAIPVFEGWLVDRLANKEYRLATTLIAAGTGTNEPTGLTTITQTGTYTKAAITYADVMAIIAALPSQYAPGAAFVMSRTTFYGNVLSITDTAKHPIVVADVQAPAKFNILGYPVILEDAVGTDIIFGDLKEGYVWNFGMDVTIERDTSAGFRAGSVVFRGMALADGKPTGVGLVRYTKAAS
jgi:HK97 family phage major capsid protein